MPGTWGRTLADLGTVSYSYGDHTFVFPPALESSVLCEPVYTRDKRAVKYRRYTLTIDCILTAEDLGNAGAVVTNGATISVDAVGGADISMSELRKLLTTPGGTLTFSGHGLGGTLVVSKSQDLEFGPKPQLAEYDFPGANNAIHLKWVVEVAIGDCAGSPSQFFTEWNYSISFSIDEAGLTTRTIYGYCESPVFRLAGNRIDKSVDQQLEKVVPQRVPGFKRTQDRTISADKRGMDFTITDKEIDSPWPFFKNMVDIKADFTVQSNQPLVPSGSIQWSISLNGSFHVKAGVSQALGWTAFITIMNDRLEKFKPNPQGNDNTSAGPGLRYMSHLSIKEQLFGRTTDISATWLVSSTLEDILKSSGLWKKVPSGSWQEWQVSLEDVLWPRGSAGAKNLPEHDKIIIYCEPSEISRPQEPSPRTESVPRKNPFVEKCPDKEHSYISYYVKTQLLREGNTVRHDVLGNGDSIKVLTGDHPSKLGLDVTGTSTVVQDRGASTVRLVLYGHAERLCYPVEKPRAEAYGKPLPVLQESKEASLIPIRRSATGLPIYYDRFFVVFELDARRLQSVEYKGIPTKFVPLLPKE